MKTSQSALTPGKNSSPPPPPPPCAAVKLSLVVPCFNEADALPLFYAEATAVLAALEE
jgi:hypothetical protein